MALKIRDLRPNSTSSSTEETVARKTVVTTNATKLVEKQVVAAVEAEPIVTITSTNPIDEVKAEKVKSFVNTIKARSEESIGSTATPKVAPAPIPVVTKVVEKVEPVSVTTIAHVSATSTIDDASDNPPGSILRIKNVSREPIPVLLVDKGKLKQIFLQAGRVLDVPYTQVSDQIRGLIDKKVVRQLPLD